MGEFVVLAEGCGGSGGGGRKRLRVAEKEPQLGRKTPQKKDEMMKPKHILEEEQRPTIFLNLPFFSTKKRFTETVGFIKI